MTQKAFCYECGEELQDQETRYDIGNGEHVCEDCRDNYYVYCEDCEVLIYYDETFSINNGAIVCEDCASEYYTCDCCGNLYSEYSVVVSTFERTLCECCYNDHYFTCAYCGEVYHLDDGEYINNDY